MLQKRSVFACALVFSPERMAGQTACPEESPARVRKRCKTKVYERWVGKGLRAWRQKRI